MHPADKAVLRLAVGLGLATLLAYGMGMQLPFMACVLAVVLLCKPGPPLPFVKGVLVGAIVAALLVAGILMVPLLEHYRLAGLLLVATLLYAVFLAGARSASPVTTILVVALTIIPAAGVAEQQLATALAKGFGVGLGVGAFVGVVSHALFPDAPRPGAAGAPPAGASAVAARWTALQATLVVLPVFVLALTNPSMYMAAIMKSVLLGQQAGATNARSAGHELVGSTLAGALMATAVWAGLSMLPNLWMLMLWLVAAALWAGRRLFQVRPSAEPPSFWLNALTTMLIVLGPAIEDTANGKDVYAASAFRVTLYVGVAFYAWALVWVLERWRAGRARLLLGRLD